MRPTVILAAVLATVLASGSFVLPATAEEAAAAEPSVPALPAISVTEVVSQRLSDRIIASGLIAALVVAGLLVLWLRSALRQRGAH